MATLSILHFFYGIGLFFLQGIQNILLSAYDYLSNLTGISLDVIIQHYIDSMSGFGMWAPIVMIVSLLTTGAIIYVELIFGKSVEDLE